MAICTLKGHVSRALDFYHKNDVYFGIGHPSKWNESEIDSFEKDRDYDRYPPAPKNTDELIDVIGYKKVEARFMVVQDDTGSLEYRGTRWKIVEPSDAIKDGSRWVYISTELAYNELPVALPYRQLGVYSGLKLKDDVNSSLYAVLPDQVKDEGILEVLDNRKPVYRDSDVREKIKLILEF